MGERTCYGVVCWLKILDIYIGHDLNINCIDEAAVGSEIEVRTVDLDS